MGSVHRIVKTRHTAHLPRKEQIWKLTSEFCKNRSQCAALFLWKLEAERMKHRSSLGQELRHKPFVINKNIVVVIS